MHEIIPEQVYPEIASEGVDGNPIFAFTTETQHI
jgi:hypothetical protein